MLNRIILGIEYLGLNYQGWQTQPSGNTIQDVLEMALEKFAKVPIQTFCAGRTDAGVHAVEQIVHFDTELNREMYSWVNGVNAFLPSDIAVKWARQIHIQREDQHAFHARFSAYARTYHYLVHNANIRSSIWSGRAGWCFRPLDLELMQQGAEFLLGEHDFTVFRAAACQAKSPVKNMYDVQIRKQGELIIFSLRANAFLHHMVRNIVGSLIFVGMERRDPVWIKQLLVDKDRSQAAPTFMPDGLYLAKIDYDSRWRLPETNGENLPYGLLQTS
ncbi:tRNA pseudouridine(38-40) synthase TruA [Undibacterium fentianense]|uniref:tRNA pseudouridine synthase A n=1 Tax=Undibacterium fentianense TaxID=2828728 RepID=A0A941E3B4_9BURK|nr:tRNA pseudouridine(38-40) synthase TruA [Undibacterium fentianense]MBR7800307.1 tRNA pseudouridine(38-40) synthase TruA [Undibacterium fentianense]